MQPVKITIPGKFWDTQIYRGKLLLFSQAAAIQTIEWDRLIDSVLVEDGLRLVARCAFLRSDYLYGSDFDLFFDDPEIKTLLTTKFQQLSDTDIVISPLQLKRCEFGEQQNPFPFPHSDTLIYDRQMYAASDQGLFRSRFEPKRDRAPIGRKPTRKWDGPTISLAGSYGSIALAAGEQGLWEVPAGTDYADFDEPRRTSARECDDCDFMYFNIFGTSYQAGGFLAEFERPSAERDSVSRSFVRELSSTQIFHNLGHAWGHRDKIYSVRDGTVQVIRYNPFGDQQHIEPLPTVNIARWKGDFVSGGVATFGAVFEYDNAIVVMPSEGDPVTIHGEVVRWRVFPGSRFYQNQLHVVFEDRIEIYSFNQDYFVNQGAKVFGTRVVLPQQRSGSHHGRTS